MKAGEITEVAGLRLRGVSVAGVETCLELPDWGICFDIGRCPPTAVRCRTLLISHGHADHLGGLIHHVSLRAMQGMAPTRVVAAAGLITDIEALLECWRRTTRSVMPCELLVAEPGVELALGKQLSVWPSRASHRVETLAYALTRTTFRLKEAFRASSGPELGALQREGVAIREPVARVEVGFTGDSRGAVLDREPRLRSARVLFGECTFLDESDAAARADRTGHMCLADWATRADRLENEAIVLTHFSQRYAPERIHEALGRLPQTLRERVQPLL